MQYIIGDKISSIRKKLGMTQAQFADVSGLSASYIAKIELGYSFPAPKNFILIMEKLELEFSDILDFLANYVEFIGYGESQILSKEFHGRDLSYKFYKHIFDQMTVYKYSDRNIEYISHSSTDENGFTSFFFVTEIMNFFLLLNEKYSFVQERERFQTFISLLNLLKSSIKKFALYFVKRSDCEKIDIDYSSISIEIGDDELDESLFDTGECNEAIEELEEYVITENEISCGAIDEIISSKSIIKPNSLLNTPFYHGYAQYNKHFPVVILFLESSAYDMINELTLETDPNIIILKDIIKKIKSDNGSVLSKQAYKTLGEFLSYINNSLGHNS